jgi:hypothetical protein
MQQSIYLQQNNLTQQTLLNHVRILSHDRC